MFIRVVKKQRSKDAKTFFQYNLVQASRIGHKVKQRVILYLGSASLMADKTNRNHILNILKSNIFSQPELFPVECDEQVKTLGLSLYDKYLIRYGLETPPQDHDATSQAADHSTHTPPLPSIPPLPPLADYHQVDLHGLQVVDTVSFGGEHLCQQLLDKLQLADCLKGCGMTPQQVDKARIAIAARALFAASEYKTAQMLSHSSSLKELYHYDQAISHKALYAISDQLYHHREAIDLFLYRRFTDMFDLEDKIVIFDISNTYFETSKSTSTLAKYGRSKEKRYDCPLVVFTAVINAQGFIKNSRIYEGNKADVKTVDDMIEDLEANAQQVETKKTVVMDAGMASEENLRLIRAKGYHYVCVSRHRIKDYEVSTAQTLTQLTRRGKGQVKLHIFHPDDYEDTWMYVQSDEKRKKEQSMKHKLHERLIEDFSAIQEGLSKKGGTKRIEKVWERIGRVKEKHKNVSGQYQIEVEEDQGKATRMRWSKKTPTKAKEDKEQGVYFIRTNYENPNEKELWDIYNTIREVESTFRCLKSELNIRPVHHQKDERIESHIYLTILAYQLVNTIRHMLKEKGIRYDWKNIVTIMSTQMLQTIELPTDKKNIHLRKPARPIKEVQQIYQATQCTSMIPARKKYVVYH